MFPNAPTVNKTMNYDLFKKIDWNRSVDKGNFQKPLKENRDNFQLHRFPILVNKEMQIVDGQHRYEVSKELGAPIYFIQDEKLDGSFEAVHSVNKAGKKHSLKDKLEMLYRAGDEAAKKVFQVYNLYNGTFEVTLVAKILATGETADGGSKLSDKVDRTGGFTLTNYDTGIEVLDALYHSSIPDKGKRKIVVALMALHKINGVHPKAIVKRVQDNPSKWDFPRSKEEAEATMARSYNYNLEVKNRIKTSKMVKGEV